MHTCPGCGQACYCNGDVDDCPVDPTVADACAHCPDVEELAELADEVFGEDEVAPV